MARTNAQRRAADAKRKREARARAREEKENREAAIAAGHGVADDVIESAVVGRNVTVLEAIRDDDKALNADRIRAATELGKLEASANTVDPYADIKALKDALLALPEGERVGALDRMVGVLDATGSDTLEINVPGEES